MKNGTGNSIRSFVAAVLVFGGLVTIGIGIVAGIARVRAPICDLATTCIAAPAASPALAEGVHRSATD
jgi:hypothetical protein